VLHRVKKDRHILKTMKIRKVNRIDHSLRRKCLLKQIIEGKIKENLCDE
jgi:hypothetical protein